MTPCTNCGAPQERRYCGECGQKRVHPGIRFGEVVHEFFGTLTHVEGPIPQTLLGSLRAPGKVTRQFIAGRRKAFVPPVRYFLVGVGYYYLFRLIFQWDPVDNAVAAMNGHAGVETGTMRVNHWMSKHVNLLLPVLVVMLAAADRLLFPRTTLTWTERVVHYLFAAGTYLFVTTTLLPLSKLWPAIHFINFFIIFFLLIRSTIALHARTAWNAIKAVLMSPITFFLYVMLCSVVVALILGVPIEELFRPPGKH